MRIDFSCPISGEQRDNNAVRIVALLSLITAIVIGILILCAFLESALSLCLGCIVYSLLPKRIGNALAHDFAAPRAG
jgi:hypothetical protein